MREAQLGNNLRPAMGDLRLKVVEDDLLVCLSNRTWQPDGKNGNSSLTALWRGLPWIPVKPANFRAKLNSLR